MAKKRGRKSKRLYFTEDTEQAIVEYLASDDQDERNKIYNDRIHHSFYKLSENLINNFKFYYTEVDDLEHLKHEVICFLLEKLHYFKLGKGKAFSYFSIVAKNYLIQNNNRHYKDLKNKAPLTVLDTRRDIPGEVTAQERLEGLEVFIDRFAEYYDKRIDSKFRNDRDKKIAGALLVLFRDRKNIEIFNKKALYIMIREMTNTKTQHITKVVNVIREDFAELYKKFNEGRFF